MSDKIQPQHLQRKAVLYVRQSSVYQVTHNLESQKLQYGMEQRVRQLGWQEIEVIDEDLGRSAAGSTQPRASNAWYPKYHLEKWGWSPLVRYRAPPAIAESGNNWWKSAASSTPCSWIRIPSTLRGTVMTGCYLA